MGFDYFYNRDGDRFHFYRVPQVFEESKFKALSNDAKIMYAFSKVLKHDYPIVIDSFRTEDLSTERKIEL